MYIEKKGIAKCIILSIVTCGIYGIVWFVQLTDDAARASGNNSMSGIKSLLLGLVTCGIYYFYWAYKMGKLVQEAKIRNGMSGDDNSILYLFLQFAGLGIVNYCLMQSELNHISDNSNNNGGGFGGQPMEQQMNQQPNNGNNPQ